MKTKQEIKRRLEELIRSANLIESVGRRPTNKHPAIIALRWVLGGEK